MSDEDKLKDILDICNEYGVILKDDSELIPRRFYISEDGTIETYGSKSFDMSSDNLTILYQTRIYIKKGHHTELTAHLKLLFGDLVVITSEEYWHERSRNR